MSFPSGMKVCKKPVTPQQACLTVVLTIVPGVYQALLISFVTLTLALCTLTLYTAYALWRKLMYLGEILHASTHQSAMRNASSRLMVNMNIFLAWIIIQVGVLLGSMYTTLRPRHTLPGLVILFWYVKCHGNDLAEAFQRLLTNKISMCAIVCKNPIL